MSYGGSTTVTVPAKPSSLTAAKPAHSCACGGPDPHQCHCHDHDQAAAQRPPVASPTNQPPQPDFSRLTQAEKLAFNRARLDRIFGGGSSGK